MENFAERYGYEKVKSIQLETMDDDLRIRLYNFTLEQLAICNCYRDQILSELSNNYFIVERGNYNDTVSLIREEILSGQWYKVYSLVEFIIPIFVLCNKRGYVNMGPGSNNVVEKLNIILEIEKAAYRYVSDNIVPISNECELKSLDDSSNTHYSSINIHMNKAIKLYSDRTSPDYENSIKESISAIEAMCCIIVENDNAMLSSALDKFKKKGVRIHPALIQAFKSLYGYASDEDGIRHAGIEFKNAPSEDAKYMLVSCSSFVNYLIEKYEKVNTNLLPIN